MYQTDNMGESVTSHEKEETKVEAMRIGNEDNRLIMDQSAEEELSTPEYFTSGISLEEQLSTSLDLASPSKNRARLISIFR